MLTVGRNLLPAVGCLHDFEGQSFLKSLILLWETTSGIFLKKRG